jgi:paraquat-inducible protein A
VKTAQPSETLPSSEEEVACRDCALVQRIPRLDRRAIATCARCGAVLHAGGHADSTPLALAIAGLCCAVVANLYPVIRVQLGGRMQENLLATGPGALIHDDYWSLAVLVALFSIIVPVLWLLAVAWVLFHVHRSRPRTELGPVFRAAEWLRPWAMTEVYVIGAYVAYTRLEELGWVTVKTGGLGVAAMAFLTFLVDRTLDRRHVWDAIGAPGSDLAREGRLSCWHCDLVNAGGDGERCPRCRGVLWRRKPRSLERTLALVIAGAALYVPANILPIMAVGRLGRPNPNTIISGISELARRGLWPLAAIVLFASILVPVLKLFSLTWFLLAVRQRWRWGLAFRTRLFRVVDGVGRWSNIDVFMISILVALVQFGVLARVEAMPGAVAFAAVVVITMFAVEVFDPRLMWDAAEAEAPAPGGDPRMGLQRAGEAQS